MTGGSWLLDVNALVALAWPNHVGHRTMRPWFEKHAVTGWATTPVTETGFVRVCSNRAVLPTSTTPGTATDMLRALRRISGHEFWVDDVELVTGPHLDMERLRGHGQVTDAHLVGLCRRNGGRLVTFDKGLAELARSVGAGSESVLLVA